MWNLQFPNKQSKILPKAIVHFTTILFPFPSHSNPLSNPFLSILTHLSLPSKPLRYRVASVFTPRESTAERPIHILKVFHILPCLLLLLLQSFSPIIPFPILYYTSVHFTTRRSGISNILKPNRFKPLSETVPSCRKTLVIWAQVAALGATMTVWICPSRAIQLETTIVIWAVSVLFVGMIRKPPDPLFVLRGHTTSVTCLYHQPENEVCFSGYGSIYDDLG